MSETVDILAFGAHPDDVEIGMGGTIAKHVQAGYRVAICDLTEAEMSSNGTVDRRRMEAADASAVLGLSARTCLKLPDRGLSGSPDQIAAIVTEIRRFRPRIVFAPYWDDRHPDHNACSALVEEAVFNAKLRRYMPELPPVQVEQLVFYYINDIKDVSLMVDISDYYEAKRLALQAYQSQFEAPDRSNGHVATPLNQGYLTNVEARDRLLGSGRLWSYAEGFALKRPQAIQLF
ncbi:bacillithiol biosynthesis deacetylase BshB1 [Paenibacillus abyssi]|uniref:Bacillithiol biosynthesis deacetylase BshB1 n=1 Tax=Paenibacillus abyssi TaxID=1340531 RepID=A0A917CHG7_9BACL|nr:bacillithiol biosynthesis deacetylase BshB1 [Paenibacillus abyssi]GGF89012.1 bacillithiol biosynthesis deacetylase BshB1 [Paenibacillus abyssi]